MARAVSTDARVESKEHTRVPRRWMSTCRKHKTCLDMPQVRTCEKIVPVPQTQLRPVKVAASQMHTVEKIEDVPQVQTCKKIQDVLARGSSALRAGGSHALRAGDGASSSAVLDSAVEIFALIQRKKA